MARKVRDHDRFFSPLGLESEGIAVDFQVGVNDYLYGTRFFSYLALTYGPRKGSRLAPPARRQQGFLCRTLQAGLRPPAGRRVERLDRLRTEVPAGKPRQARAISADPDANAQPQWTGLDLARLRRPEDQQPDRRVPLSWHDWLRRPSRPRQRQADQAPGNQGHDALPGDEPRVRSRCAHRLLHRGQ